LKVSETGDDWDEHLNHALFDVRIRPHTATKFSPFDFFHSWKFRFNPSDSETSEENEHLEVLQSGDRYPEEQIDKSCEEMVARFNKAKDLITEEAAANIKREQHRQKTAFDKKKMGHGVEIKKGIKFCDSFSCNLVFLQADIFWISRMHNIQQDFLRKEMKKNPRRKRSSNCKQ
jgi:hypothetical protein